MSLTEIRKIIDQMIECGVAFDNPIYKICPKCNPNHNGTCKHCAWNGTGNGCCDVGVWVWEDGSCGDYELQIVPKKFNINYRMLIFEWWNIQYFPTKEEAEKAMKEYNEIRKIEDIAKRKAMFDLWIKRRKGNDN